MTLDELKQNDKNMDFTVLNIKKEVQDEVMTHWKFNNVGQAMEAGILLLQTFAFADKEGCSMAYFEKEIDGKKAYFTFDYRGLIEYLKDPSRSDGSTHSVSIKKKEDIKE